MARTLPFVFLTLVLGPLLGSGCLLANVSTAEKLREAVEGTNSQARWGRLDLAAQRVHPLYREAWAEVRKEWGEELQIAGSEVASLQLDADQDGATSQVEVEWYRFDTMTLRHSTIEQRWERVEGSFALLSEEIVDGDEGLLAELPAEEPEGEPPDEEGGEAEAPSEGPGGDWSEPPAA